MVDTSLVHVLKVGRYQFSIHVIPTERHDEVFVLRECFLSVLV